MLRRAVAMDGFESLIADDVAGIVRGAIAETQSAEAAAELATARILELERVKDAFSAWWREESYSSIYDGDG